MKNKNTGELIPYIEPYSAAWQNHANALARAFVPTIYDCKKCGYPVLTGYCCSYCDDNNPSEKD